MSIKARQGDKALTGVSVMATAFAGYSAEEVQEIEDDASFDELRTVWTEVFGPFDLPSLSADGRATFQRHLIMKRIRRDNAIRRDVETKPDIKIAAV